MASSSSSLWRSIQLDGDHQQQQQHLFGRHQESKLLLEAYMRCQDVGVHKGGAAANTPECVLITGASGMGKTSLVQRVLRPRVLRDGGIFLSGKFEVSPQYQPYEVIASTFAQLADQLSTEEDHLYLIQQAVADALGDEAGMLTDVIPGLESVIGEQLGRAYQHYRNHSNGTESLSRFQFVFCEFCRAVSSIVPLVIFLDDMQWCDEASLDLIQALLRPKLCSAESNMRSSLLLVAASRDDLDDGVQQQRRHSINSSNNKQHDNPQGDDDDDHNVDNEEPPHVYMVDMFLNGSMPSRSVSRIHLASLSKAETRDLIVHHFGFSPETAQTVAQMAYSKCSGNILYTLQYMLSMQRNHDAAAAADVPRRDEAKVMEHSHHHHHHHDDTQPEQKEETVEQLILRHVHKLPLFAQELLQMAACMGTVIDEAALCTMTNDSPALEISQSLEMAAQEELLEFVEKHNQYRFIHDSVRQTVLSMITDKNELSFRIGLKLWQQQSTSSSSSCQDGNLFTIVNLLNKGVHFMNDPDERYQVAELNLRAGQRAASKVSFRDASRYCNTGIKFMHLPDCWIDHYELALQLHSAAASAELSNHNYRRVEELIGEIFQHAHCFQDKLNAYACQIVATGQQGKVVDATTIGLEVLAQLGELVPTKDHVADLRVDLIETERALRGKSNADILSLPFMDDEEKQATMRFLVMLIPYSIESGSPYANWIATRVVRLTLSYGLYKGCAHGFASYARFICASNARLGYNYGQLAGLIVEKCGARALLPRVYVSVYCFTSLWTRPLRESLNPLLLAFEVAAEHGDIEYALMAAFFRSLFSLYVGMNLVQVEQLLKETRRQLNFYKQGLWLSFINCALQFVLNLTCKIPKPHMLAGEVCGYTDRDFIGNASLSYIFHGFSCKLAYLFDDFELADQHAQVLFHMSSRVPFTSYWFALNQFQMGLIAVAQVRRGIQSEQNLERGQLCVKKMVGWARDCPHNFLNKKSLLDAELESLKPTTSIDPNVLSLYNQAIEGALDEGFLDEAAMACERAGDYVHFHENLVEADRFWNQAQRIFRRWGATAKADALKSRVSSIKQHETDGQIWKKPSLKK